MRIAVLSGKGGTGKTLVSVNLAAVAQDAAYIDCDVEAPNGHLFLKPEGVVSQPVTVKIPYADPARCNGCRQCVRFCKFNALAHIGNKLLVFEEVCHSCGGCLLICPQKALSEKEKIIGAVQEGMSGHITVKSGILNTGEASGVPIIKALLNGIADMTGDIFIDCPPGSACIVMESIKEADYCILVAEPTIFGVHNLAMVHRLVQIFQKPYGVVLNKCLEAENPAEEFCKQQGIKVLGAIPFDHELGRMNSDALIAAAESRKYEELFSGLLGTVRKEARDAAAIDS